MSDEQRELAPGEEWAEMGEMAVADGDATTTAANAEPTAADAMAAGPETAPEVAPAPVYDHWQQAPYAPPFQIAPGTGYPQLFQIPWTHFPGFPYRPDEPGEEMENADGARQIVWGHPPVFPHYLVPYHHPYFPHPYYHTFYYGHIPGYSCPVPYPYYLPVHHRLDEIGDAREDDADEAESAGNQAAADPQSARQFPIVGVSPFVPAFGVGFGLPLFPRPFPFFPYHHYPWFHHPFWW